MKDEQSKPSTQDRSGIALALSGGGYRAMLFHVGAIIRLNEMGLLKDIKRVSSVSGGSITAAYLGLKWKKLAFQAGKAENLNSEFVEPILDFSTHTIDRVCGTVGLLTQGALVSRVLTRYYDKYLFSGATLGSLPADEEGPRFVICASNLSTGSLFRFSRPYIADYRIGRMHASDFSLATAVAASSAFPPLLSPTRVDLSQFRMFEKDAVKPSEDQIDLHELPAELRSRAVLTDGGVYDNHGIEPIDDWQTMFVSDGGMPHKMSTAGFWNWYGQTRRVMDVMDNQVRSLRRRALFNRPEIAASDAVGYRGNAGEQKCVYWGIGTDSRKYQNFAELECLPEDALALSTQSTRLKDPGDPVRMALVNWGYAICDRAMRRWYQPEGYPPPQWPFPNGIHVQRY